MNILKVSEETKPSLPPRYSLFVMIGITACLVFLSTGSRLVIQEKFRDPTFMSTDEPKMSERLQIEMLASDEFEKTVNIWIYFQDKGITSQAMLTKGFEDVRK
jgi:hypothetical protein